MPRREPTVEEIVEQCRQVAAETGMAWIGDLVMEQLDLARVRSEEWAA